VYDSAAAGAPLVSSQSAWRIGVANPTKQFCLLV